MIRKPADRPSWWTPEKCLECLQGGERVHSLCRRASDETGGVVNVLRLRADISAWAESASWGEQFQAALRLYRRGEVAKVSTEWFPDFYAAMDEAEGKVELACEIAGVKPALVYAIRDKRNKSVYNAGFDEQVRILEMARLSRIRENVLNQAAAEGIDGAKIGLKVLESGMPGLHGQKQHVEVSGGVQVEHLILTPEVVAASQARTRALLAGRERHRQAEALPSGERNYIDAEVVEREKAPAR